MKTIIALAAGLMATGALAQSSTMQTTTTTSQPAPMEKHEMKSTMQHSETHMSGDRDRMMRHHHHMNRKCYHQMRHGKQVHVCRSRHNHM